MIVLVNIAAGRKVHEMVDIGELFGPEAWKPIQEQLRRDEDPELSEIALALRGRQPIPHDVRCYIADLLERKIQRKRGRRVDRSDSKKLRDMAIFYYIDYWIEVCKRAQRREITTPGGAYVTAREKVSKRTGIPESTLDKIYYPRQKPKKDTP